MDKKVNGLSFLHSKISDNKLQFYKLGIYKFTNVSNYS